MDTNDILNDVQLIDLTHRDAQFVRAELTKKINAAIAAAVQAAREECAVMGDQLSFYFASHPGANDAVAAEVCRNYAAAIRARGEGGK